MLKICKKNTNGGSEDLTLVPAVRMESPCKLVRYVGEQYPLDYTWKEGDYWIKQGEYGQTTLWKRQGDNYGIFYQESPQNGQLYYCEDTGKLLVWDASVDSFKVMYEPKELDMSEIRTTIKDEVRKHFAAVPFARVESGDDITVSSVASGTARGEVVYNETTHQFLLYRKDEDQYYENWTLTQGDHSSSEYKDADFVFTPQKQYLVTSNGLIE